MLQIHCTIIWRSYTGRLHTGRFWQWLLPGIMTFVLGVGTQISETGLHKQQIKLNNASIWTQWTPFCAIGLAREIIEVVHLI